MVCVKSDSKDFVGVCRVDCGSIDLNVELCVVFSGSGEEMVICVLLGLMWSLFVLFMCISR